MKSLLLALALAAAPAGAVNVEAPGGGAKQGPAAAPAAQTPAVSVPVVPSFAAGVGIGMPSIGLGVAGAPAALPPAAANAPRAELSGPKAAGPKAAPQEGQPSAALTTPGEQASPKATDETSPAKAAAGQAHDAQGSSAAAAGSKAGSEAGPDAARTLSVSAETAKAQSDSQFDGQTPKPGDAPAVAAPKGMAGRVLARLGLSKPNGAEAARPKTPFDRDSFGGPQTLSLSKKQKLAYGLRWGLTLTGLSTTIQLALGTLFAFFPWQLHAPHGLLQSAGRIELMTGAGPHAIAQTIATHPLLFFLGQLPMSTLKEEVVFRFLGFGLTFLLVAAVRPAMAGAVSFLDKVPDLFGQERFTKAALTFAGKISSRAFTVAAAISALSFAMAHFAAWGVDPVTMTVHATLGFALAYVAYKTRSIMAAFMAHLTYNLLSVAGVALALYVSPLVGIGYSLGLSVVSIAALYLHWRSYRKAKILAQGGAKKLSLRAALSISLLAGLLAAALVGMAPRHAPHQASQRSVAAYGIALQQAEPGQEAEAPTPAEEQAALEAFKQLTAAVQGQEAERPLGGVAAMTKAVKPAVVEVDNPGIGLGSGFIISKDGLLLTNAHVVEGNTSGFVIVKLENGMQGAAKIVAVNRDKDIALVQLPKLKSGEWPHVAIAAGDMAEGEEVIAMGHPLGLPFTVTKGIVSGVGAHRNSLYVDYLQHDATITHGNSGGPLLNDRGEVVGMNTWGESETVNLNFAISAKDLRAAVEQYRAMGNINSAWLGIIVNTQGEQTTDRGFVVEQVRPGSPADKAGIKPGDLVLGANGQMFGAPSDALTTLAITIARSKPGEPIVVAIGREGQVGVAQIKLADKK